MNVLGNLLEKLKRRPAFNPLDYPVESVVPARERRILDGLDYALPTLLPEHMREQMARDGTLATYLREDARATLRFQFDTPQRSADDMPIDPVTDDPLMEWSYTTRMKVLSNTHAVFQRNPIASAAVKYTVDFVLGEHGFGITYQNKAVEEVLEAFIQSPDNKLRMFERQALQDLQVDGEIVLRTIADDGMVVIVPQRPWELRYIKLQDGILTRPESYVFLRQSYQSDVVQSNDNYRAGEEDEIPADEIIHVAINQHAYELQDGS